MDDLKYEAGLAACAEFETRNWSAWNNLRPPLPNTFSIEGEVKVPNPAVDVFMAVAEPQGFNPEVLLLDIHLLQRPGTWPARPVWRAVAYRRIIGATGYTRVDLRHDGDTVAGVDVQNAH